MGCADRIDISHGSFLVGPLIHFAFSPSSHSQCGLWQLRPDAYLCGCQIWRFLGGFLEKYEKEHANFKELVPLLSGRARSRIERAKWALVMRASCPSGAPSSDEHDLFEPMRRAVLALRLIADGPLYADPMVWLSDGEVKDIRSLLDRPQHFDLPAAGNEVPPKCGCLQESDLPKLRGVLSVVEKAFEMRDDSPRLWLALRLYELSWRVAYADIRAVLLWTVLESLFHKEGVCSGRSPAKCAATVLSAEKGEPQDLKEEFEGLYDLRNRVAHGERLGSNKQEREEAVKLACDCQGHLRELFVEVCERRMIQHFESKESWAAWVCGLLEEQA